MTILLPRTSGASDTALAALIEKYGNLPHEYVDFLASYDGVKPPSNVLEGTNYNIGVNEFIPASGIISKANSIEDFEKNLLPFGEDDSGNFLCIDIKDHRVYFWDHEIDNTKVIAESFGEFLDKLEPFDCSSVKIQGVQTKRVWTNPNFKPEF